jgi:hypothetical protein
MPSAHDCECNALCGLGKRRRKADIQSCLMLSRTTRTSEPPH